MVLSLLARQRGRVPLDAADALALAICHIHAAPPRAPTRELPAHA
jgi:Holliday junction resolvasome RuvABC endonuclease subunit